MIRETHAIPGVKKARYQDYYRHWDKPRRMIEVGLTVSEVWNLTNYLWSSPVENVLTILNGARPLGELVKQDNAVMTNHTQYHHHDLSHAPSLTARPQPRHKKDRSAA